jgi:hypothetical protein
VIAAALAAVQARAASGVSEASFLASLNGTITKQWSYTTTQTTAGGCTVTTTGKGRRVISLRSADDSILRARKTAGGRAGFSGRVRFLTEALRQSGTKTTVTTGPSGCAKSTQRLVCKRLTRSLANRAARPVSNRAHELTFRRMSGLVPRSFLSASCPGEPAEVRSIAGGLELASARFREADLFDRNVGGLTLRGGSDVTTETLSGSATVLQHVGWGLRLRRLGN